MQALPKGQKLKVAKYTLIHGTAPAIHTFRKEVTKVESAVRINAGKIDGINRGIQQLESDILRLIDL